MTTIASLPFSTRGRLKELILLFLPLLGTTFCNYFYLLVEKLFLARVSPVAMEAAINVSYACQIFQGASVALAMMAQVFIGRWYGARSFSSIGPGTWQFIWFSFLSMLVTVPASLIYGSWYFEGTSIESIGMPYFYLLIGTNFLYPLSAVLSCFYLGQGKTRLVLIANGASQLMKIGLAYVLIFGIESFNIPALGLIGGAISTVSAQALFCFLLGAIFLNRSSRALFNSASWYFSPALFWECIYPGLLRAFNRILNFTSWASIAHLMLSKGGDYLLILSLGGVLSLFLPFLFEAVCQAQTTVISYILGSKSYNYLLKAIQSGFILVFILALLMSVPLVLFPSLTFDWLFPEVVLDPVVIQKVFLGVWLSFVFFTSTAIPISCVLALKDMKFSCFMGLMNWVNGYCLMYVALELIQIPASLFWLTLSLMHGSTLLIYFWRVRALISSTLLVGSYQSSKL